MKINFKLFNRSLAFALLCVIFMSLARFNVACDDLRHNVLRLHIVANSNSTADQALKLKIRDRILAESGNLFDGITTTDDALKVAAGETERFCKIANEVIRENGFSQVATAQIGDSYFETRVYDDFTLPAGWYKALIIKIGKAEGKNWWCVIFPEVCLPAASGGELSDTTDKKSAQIAEKPDRYVMRFKVVEIYEKIKNLF